MSRYFLDTEFLEGPQKKLFGQTKPTIDLISIGIVSEDGREYYAVSKDFNLKEAWNRYQMKQVYGDARNRFPEGIREYWIRENVLRPIFKEWKQEANGKIIRLGLPIPLNELKFNYKNFKDCIKCVGKSNEQIANEIVKFVYPNAIYNHPNCNHSDLEVTNCADSEKPEFYAYYADYDWVAFCWLFGKMIDLPKGFPMYCRDLKQELDRVGNDKKLTTETLDSWLDLVKKRKDYPKQTNEHNAIADARWNHELYKFLNSYIFEPIKEKTR
tara:strand:- start:786 stop:1595 length:810 start_codon:yes stop_codon:yes gene_type:complete